jgi:hypothetical protein
MELVQLLQILARNQSMQVVLLLETEPLKDASIPSGCIAGIARPDNILG